MQQQRPVRPVGVVLSAIALGLAALLLVLFSLGGLVTALNGPRVPQGSLGGPVPSAALYTVITLSVSVLYLALAGWAAGTMIGLLRMRSWARISSIVIAACMVGFGLLFALGMTGAQSILAAGSVPLPPNVSPAMIHKVLLVFAGIFLFVAALGLAALIYFAQTRTRDAFTQAKAPQDGTQATNGEPGYYPPAPGMPAWPAPQVRPAPRPNPLTDFTVARPLEMPPTPPAASPAPPSTEEPG